MKTDDVLILETIVNETGVIPNLAMSLDSLKLDSLEFVDLILHIEAACEVKIPDLAIVRMNTVEDIVKIVGELKSACVVQN